MAPPLYRIFPTAAQALMVPSASAALVVYAVGVPCIFMWRLNMHKEVLRAAAPQVQLGFLFRDYEDSCVAQSGASFPPQNGGMTPRPTNWSRRYDDAIAGRPRQFAPGAFSQDVARSL